MRVCRQFLAGIPHPRPGHPCVTHPSATPSLSRKKERTFDLHVLGTPPAFILSQDQTRHPIGSMSPSTCPRQATVSSPWLVQVAIQAKLLLFFSVHAYLAVRRFLLARCCSSQRAGRASLILLTGTVSDACASGSSCCSAFHSSVVKVPKK